MITQMRHDDVTLSGHRFCTNHWFFLLKTYNLEFTTMCLFFKANRSNLMGTHSLTLTYRMLGRVKETLHISLHISRSITWTSTFPQQKKLRTWQWLAVCFLHIWFKLFYLHHYFFFLCRWWCNTWYVSICALPASSQRVHDLLASVWLLQSCFSVYLALRLMLTQVRHGNVSNLAIYLLFHQRVALSLSRILFHFECRALPAGHLGERFGIVCICTVIHRPMIHHHPMICSYNFTHEHIFLKKLNLIET